MKTPTKIRLLILGSTLCVSQVAFAYTPPAEFQIHQIPLSTNDIAFSALSKHLLVTVPSSPGLGVGNSITHIDPRSGKILTSVFVGSEPGPIGLSSDGGTAYIGMGGAPLVRRYNVGTMTAGAQSPLGSDSTFGFFHAEDIAVKPGDPNTFVVSRSRAASPRHGGVAAFVNGTQLPDTTQDHTGSNRIEFSDQPDTLFGLNNETTEFGLRTVALDATGVHETNVIGEIGTGFGDDIEFQAGRLYTSGGVVFDPTLGIPVGTYGSGVAAIEPDSTNGVTFAIESNFGNPSQLTIFDQTSFIPITHYDLSGVTGTPTDLVSLGDAGLALRTDDFSSGSKLYLLSPVPEPEAWVIISLGVLLVAIRRACRLRLVVRCPVLFSVGKIVSLA